MCAGGGGGGDGIASMQVTPTISAWRRLLRFRVSTLLWVTTAICLFLGYQSSVGQRQRAAIAQLRQLGAVSIGYDIDVPAGKDIPHSIWKSIVRWTVGRDHIDSVWGCGLQYSTATDEVLAESLSELLTIRSLQLDFTNAGDRTLAVAEKMSDLQNVSLVNTDVTDAGIVKLQHLKIQNMDLRGTKVSDAVVEILRAKIPRCKVLSGPF